MARMIADVCAVDRLVLEASLIQEIPYQVGESMGLTDVGALGCGTPKKQKGVVRLLATEVWQDVPTCVGGHSKSPSLKAICVFEERFREFPLQYLQWRAFTKADKPIRVRS